MLKYIYFSLLLFLSFHTFETMDKSEIKALTLAVYDIVKMIPYGRATSYGAIAKAIGYPNMSRLVGRIMSECNSQITGLPAHRVVNSQGILSGRKAFGEDTMQNLLQSEGVNIINNRIQNWKTIFWDPLKEVGDYY